MSAILHPSVQITFPLVAAIWPHFSCQLHPEVIAADESVFRSPLTYNLTSSTLAQDHSTREPLSVMCQLRGLRCMQNSSGNSPSPLYIPHSMRTCAVFQSPTELLMKVINVPYVLNCTKHSTPSPALIYTRQLSYASTSFWTSYWQFQWKTSKLRDLQSVYLK